VAEVLAAWLLEKLGASGPSLVRLVGETPELLRQISLTDIRVFSYISQGDLVSAPPTSCWGVVHDLSDKVLEGACFRALGDYAQVDVSDPTRAPGAGGYWRLYERDPGAADRIARAVRAVRGDGRTLGIRPCGPGEGKEESKVMEQNKHTDDIITPEIREQIRIRREKLTKKLREGEEELATLPAHGWTRTVEAGIRQIKKELAELDEAHVRRSLEWQRENVPRLERETEHECLAATMENLIEASVELPPDAAAHRWCRILRDYARHGPWSTYVAPSLAGPVEPEDDAGPEAWTEYRRALDELIPIRYRRLAREITSPPVLDVLAGDAPDRTDRAARIVVGALAA
jgi:hypothetical protein